MAAFTSLSRRIKAVRTLGFQQAAWYALYQLGLRSGHYRRATPSRYESAALEMRSLWQMPSPELTGALIGEPGRKELDAEAAEILAGQVRLFGGPPVAIRLQPPGELQHWSAYETHRAGWGVEDVKFIWEPARFVWAYTLGRAYHLSGDERYPASFWQQFEAFDRANPPNMGPNWASAQEAALRMVAWLFADAVFARSRESTPQRKRRLAQAVAEHAARIPLTLPYARAQHNNHLLSEALGLYAAGLALAAHPQAVHWRETGWREINRALLSQIARDGTYAQHSTNYHRLALQAALLADAFCRAQGRDWPEETLTKLRLAVLWLDERTDPLSGRAANLGHNDGAHILPLAGGGFGDFRPTLRAAATAFGLQLNGGSGPWDELAAWLGLQEPDRTAPTADLPLRRLHSAVGQGWASLRAQRFTSRPAHADQLHVEIWHNGENIAMDAGTYRYNAPPPWENALASTLAHNTLSIDGLDQMTRSGKFLWLDWAQGEWLETSPHTLVAAHDGYRRLGIRHLRELWREEGGWRINDDLLPLPGQARASHTCTLHWLLPDWNWLMEDAAILRLEKNNTIVRVSLDVVSQRGESAPPAPEIELIRAGKQLLGSQAAPPNLGWRSPAYDLRLPALSLRLSVTMRVPLRLTSLFESRQDDYCRWEER